MNRNHRLRLERVLLSLFTTSMTVTQGFAGDISPPGDPSRPWHVSLGVEEEYTDNVDTTSAKRQSSFNTTFNPRLQIGLVRENTSFNLQYDYAVTYLSHPSDQPQWEQSHVASVSIHHAFNPRLSLDLSDTVVRGIEPQLVVQANGTPTVVRLRGDYLENSAGGGVHYDLTERWVLSGGGRWTFWMFDDSTEAKLNDRNTYEGDASIGYIFSPRTTVSFVYQVTDTVYDHSNLFDINNVPVPHTGGARNSLMHAPSIDLAYKITPKLTLDVGVGADITDFEDGRQDITPAAHLTLAYAYLPKGTAAIGFDYGSATTEVGTYRRTDTATVFARVDHPLTGKLHVGAEVDYSHSSFEDPAPTVPPVPTGAEQTVLASLTLSYDVTRWFTATIRYSYDQVFSDLPDREYYRDRVFIGGRVTY